MIAFGQTPAEFRARHFESAPLLVRRGFDPTTYSWTFIDEALDLQDPTGELLKVLRNGRIAPEEYVEEFVDIGIRRRRIRKKRLYAEIGQGATVMLNRRPWTWARFPLILRAVQTLRAGQSGRRRPCEALHSTVQAGRATAGLLLTTSRFTKGARQFQTTVEHHLSLADYVDFRTWLADAGFG